MIQPSHNAYILINCTDELEILILLVTKNGCVGLHRPSNINIDYHQLILGLSVHGRRSEMRLRS